MRIRYGSSVNTISHICALSHAIILPNIYTPAKRLRLFGWDIFGIFAGVAVETGDVSVAGGGGGLSGACMIVMLCNSTVQ